ncbi:MAG: hypothetical protein HY246_02935, partial [Proteobacteria bacterium]|nr:hypothetical protein [Pseudomonadota bacterium]
MSNNGRPAQSGSDLLLPDLRALCAAALGAVEKLLSAARQTVGARVAPAGFD